VGDGKRSGAGSHAGHALPVLTFGRPWQQMLDITLLIGSHALQAADCYWLAIQPCAAARRLTRTIASAAKNTREYVRLPVQHVGVGVTALRDHPDVFRNVRVRGARP